MDKEKTGLLIRQKRVELGLTQEELADALNVSKNTVSRWERGLNLPDFSIMEILAKELGIQVSELVNGEQNTTDRVPAEKGHDGYTMPKRILLVSLIVSVLALADVLYGYLAAQLKWNISNRDFKPKGLILSLIFKTEVIKNEKGAFLTRSFNVLAALIAITAVLAAILLALTYKQSKRSKEERSFYEKKH